MMLTGSRITVTVEDYTFTCNLLPWSVVSSGFGNYMYKVWQCRDSWLMAETHGNMHEATDGLIVQRT